MYIIGLTGSSGSGKTTAANILKDLGAYIIDCDKISRSITKPNMPAYRDIIAVFGERILRSDGALDRRALGDIVFSDAELLKKLENITHAAIKKEIGLCLEKAEKTGVGLVIIDAPLLIEAGLDRLCDCVWLICANPAIRLVRIIKRDNISASSALKRFENQADPEKLKKFADVVIDTSHMDIEDMKKKIIELKEKIL